MPKLLLIQPSLYTNEGTVYKQKRLFIPGLALHYLAALVPKHWDVDILIEVIEDINFDVDVDLVGIGTMGHNIIRGKDIALEFKKRGKTVFFGGYMASLAPEMVLNKGIDSVVIGDAEKSFPMLLNDFESKGKLDKIYDNQLCGLENLPLPKYELLKQKNIGDMLPVQAGRGCQNKCKFCSIASIYKGRYMSRPIPDVIRDIKRIKELGCKSFFLIDDNIISNKNYITKLVDEIKPLKMIWASQCSLQIAKDIPLLKKVKKSGCINLSFGLESISQKGLDKIGKGWLDVSKHKELLKIIEKEGITASTEMMFGTDSDTEQSIKETLDFVLDLKLPWPRFYIMTPMPGTVLYKEYKEQGKLLHEDYTKYNGSVCVHKPENISPEKLTEMYWWLYKEVYSYKNIIRRIILRKDFFTNYKFFLFALMVNIHYKKFIKRKIVPNIY